MKYFVLKDKKDSTKFYVIIRSKYTVVYHSPKSMSIFQAQKMIFEIENCLIPVRVNPVIETKEPLTERLKDTDIISLSVQVPLEYDEEPSPTRQCKQPLTTEEESEPLPAPIKFDRMDSIEPSEGLSSNVIDTEPESKAVELETLKEEFNKLLDVKENKVTVYNLKTRRKSTTVLPKL